MIDKNRLLARIDDVRDVIAKANDDVWNYAEVYFKEFQSADALAKAAQDFGFETEMGVCGMPTAFVCKWGKEGPKIGILAEYDALDALNQRSGCFEKQARENHAESDPGHGCGHNSLGAGSLGAAIGLKKYCEENDILFIIDEVQTGVGRTGKFLCSEHFNIKPDITTLAKGLGGGLPIGAMLMNKKCSDVFVAGDHASTFGANPVVCSGALEVLKIIDKKLLKSVEKKSKYIKSKLLKLDNVVSVDGIGLMLGIGLKENLNAREIVEKCIEKGVVPLTAKNKIRLLPPLTITDKELKKAVDVLCECIG